MVPTDGCALILVLKRSYKGPVICCLIDDAFEVRKVRKTIMAKKYEEEQYFEKPVAELLTGFTNYDRLLVELNNREYYDRYTYIRFLNENGLDAEAEYNKNTDHAQMLETVYAILHTLLSNIDAYRKIETEFVTQGDAATALQNRLKYLRTEIDRVKADMHYEDSDFTFLYYTR